MKEKFELAMISRIKDYRSKDFYASVITFIVVTVMGIYLKWDRDVIQDVGCAIAIAVRLVHLPVIIAERWMLCSLSEYRGGLQKLKEDLKKYFYLDKFQAEKQ